MKEAVQNKGKATKPKGSNKRVNEDNLSAEDELFCEIFASDRELFGNGVQSYIEAYGIIVRAKPNRDNPKEKTYEACKANAHDRLTKPHFLKRINQIFEGRGLNDEFVDKQLEKLITQDAEFSSKIKAIVEYNKLKKRTTQSSVDVNFGNIDPNASDLSLDQAMMIIQQQTKFFKKQ